MKIIKPLRIGLIHRTYQFKKKNWFVVSPLLFFRLGTGELLVEHLQWPLALSGPGMTTGLDMGMPKINGEVLISGFAFAPYGKNVNEQDIGFKMSSIEKRIHVVGNREWKKSGQDYIRSSAELFKKMPVSYDRAFGGKEYPENPEGCGFECVKNGDFRLPNIERITDPVNEINNTYYPEGFLPLNLSSPSQQKKAGTYNETWLKNDYPGYPSDINWELFNSAREDQRIKGYFTGGEEYEILNMHPQKQIIKGELPKLSCRVFIKKRNLEKYNFNEIETFPDTIWFFPDKELGVMIFRGQHNVNDSDALDIDVCMCAYEKIGDKKRPTDYYQKIMELRLDPKTAAGHIFNDSQLSPEKSKEVVAQMIKDNKRIQERALEEKQAAIDRSLDLLISGKKIPSNFIRPVAKPGFLPLIPQESIASADFDLSETIDHVESMAKNLTKKVKLTLKENKEALNLLELKSQKKDIDTVQQRGHIKKIEQMLHTENGSDQSSSQLEFLIPEGKAEDIKKAFGNITKGKVYARQLADSPVVSDLCSSDAEYLGNLIKKLMSVKKGITGIDCSGAKLSGVDFSGFDLKNTMFEYADLRGCNFTGAECTGAVFTAALLDDVNFSKAKMDQANLSSITAARVNFSGCSMKNALINKATFKDSKFDGALMTGIQAMKAVCNNISFKNVTCDQGMFIDALFRQSEWSNSKLGKMIFIGADLTEAKFRNSTLTKTILINAIADGADFTEAIMFQVQSGGTASFRNAKFLNSRVEECGFRSINMTGLKANQASFIKCDLGNTDLTNADFSNASLLRSVLFGTRMVNANLCMADLYESVAKKTDFTRANMFKTSLHNVEKLEAIFKNIVNEDSQALLQSSGVV
jgi:uncharacterized protein YjbI with pentapeptide repeats